MILRVTHHTRYEYPREVGFSPHALYLRPRESRHHRLRRFECVVSPDARLVDTIDPHDNPMMWAWFRAKADAMEVRTDFEIETLDRNPFDFLLKPSAASFPFAYDAGDRFALSPYLAPPFDETQAALRRWLGERRPELPAQTVPFLTTVLDLIRGAIAYRRREEGFSQPSTRTLALASGSCRDFAVLLIEICRTFGLAARFVSGYLHDEPAPDGERPPGAMHAWVEVYLPGAGWKGVDPTRGIFCDDSFIPVAHAAQANLVTPIQGRYFAAIPVTSKLSVEVTVTSLA